MKPGIEPTTETSLETSPTARDGVSKAANSVFVWLALLLSAICLGSDLSGSAWSFIPDPRLRTDALWVFVLAILVIPASSIRPPASLSIISVLVLGAVLVASFLSTLGGHLLFSDDHSTFLYRLSVLNQHFPDLATYNPGWNAGVLTTDIFVTGAVLLYLLATPLLVFLAPEQSYNFLIGALFAGVLPWSLWASARIFGFGTRSACAAALLSMGPSLLLYRWGLAYGTVPFVIVSFLTPLFYAVAVRTLRSEGSWLRWGIAFGALLNLIMFWSGSVFLIVPIIALLTLEPVPDHRILRLSRLALVGVIIILLNLWWLIEYLELIPLARFLQEGSTTNAPPAAMHPSGLEVTGNTAWSIFQKTNPFLFVLACIGLLGTQDGVSRRYAALACGFLLMATVGPQLARHLELDRMALPMSLCLTLPAASGIRMLWNANGAVNAAIGRAIVVTALVVTALSARIYWTNESVEHYSALEPPVEELIQEIRSHTRGGRTYIAGFVLHDFSKGHAAALQQLTDVPMVAVEPMHRYWWYRDPLPPHYRSSSQGFRDYLTLMNVDLVVTTDREWRTRLGTDDNFERLWTSAGYTLSRFRQFPDSWFLEGDGQVEELSQGLRVRLNSDEAVLRYAHVDGLVAEPGGSIEPQNVGGLEWIHLQGPRGQWIEISFP